MRPEAEAFLFGFAVRFLSLLCSFTAVSFSTNIPHNSNNYSKIMQYNQAIETEKVSKKKGDDFLW